MKLSPATKGVPPDVMVKVITEVVNTSPTVADPREPLTLPLTVNVVASVAVMVITSATVSEVVLIPVMVPSPVLLGVTSAKATEYVYKASTEPPRWEVLLFVKLTLYPSPQGPGGNSYGLTSVTIPKQGPLS